MEGGGTSETPSNTRAFPSRRTSARPLQTPHFLLETLTGDWGLGDLFIFYLLYLYYIFFSVGKHLVQCMVGEPFRKPMTNLPTRKLGAKADIYLEVKATQLLSSISIQAPVALGRGLLTPGGNSRHRGSDW